MDCNDDVRSIGSTRFHSLAILLLVVKFRLIEVLLAPFVVEHSASRTGSSGRGDYLQVCIELYIVWWVFETLD